MATALLLIIYLMFVSLGLPDSLFGAAWPAAYQSFGVPISYAGFTSMFITAGTILSSILSVRLIRRFGTGKVTAFCVLLTAVSMIGISFVNRYIFLCLLFIPLGLGGGSIDVALNNYVAMHYRAIHMNFLHAFWGVGASVGPLIMAAFLAKSGDWHDGFSAIGLIQLALAACAFLALPLWKKVPAGSGPERGETTDEASLALAGNGEALRNPGVRLCMLVFFLYVAMEVATGLWAPTYFVEVKGFRAERAARMSALFYGGIMAGRIGSGLLSVRVKEAMLIRIGLIVSFFGVFLLLLPGIYAAVGLALLGCGCAPVFPNMLKLTPERFGQRLSQAAIGVQMACSYLGSTITPPLIGFVAERYGFATFPPLLLLAAALLLLLTEWLNARCNRQPPAARM